MDTKEFEELLNKTIIPSNITGDEQIALLKPLQEYLSDNLPEKLYKYRACNERSFDAFYKDQIWFSTADRMNDGFDSRLYCNKEEIIDRLHSLLTKECIESSVETLNTDNDIATSIEMMFGKEVLQKVSNPEQIFWENLVSNREKLLDTVEYAIKNLSSASQQVSKFCSFSETIKSASMWGQYTDNETGFCLEYTFDRVSNSYCIENGLNINTTLYPVIYSKKKHIVASNVIESFVLNYLFGMKVVSDPDILAVTKVALNKSSEWMFEKEWRLVCIENSPYSSEPRPLMVEAKALYLGRRISAVNEKILRVLAAEKGIPVYKMKLNDNSPTYDLCYE